MWLFIGSLVLGAALLGLVLWMRSRDIKLTWYEWLVGIVGLLLLIFTIQNFVGSLFELEPKAAWMFWVVTGLPAVILLVLAGFMVRRHQRVT